jgi:hypothetical protein
MLMIKTKLGPSKINGIGLIADQFIPKGTVIWKYSPKFDLIIDHTELNILPEPARNAFLHYAYLNKRTGKYVLCFDNARFFNHSENPNCVGAPSPDDDEGLDIAGVDIQPGEEMTNDYREFDDDFDLKMSL